MVNSDSFEMTNMLGSEFPTVLGTCCSVEKENYYSDVIVMTIIQRKAFLFVSQASHRWLDGLFDVC